jgi:hypothetical protein
MHTCSHEILLNLNVVLNRTLRLMWTFWYLVLLNVILVHVPQESILIHGNPHFLIRPRHAVYIVYVYFCFVSAISNQSES